MTACSMPKLDMMVVLEKMVNDPEFCGHRPSWQHEPYEVVLPQRLDPLMMTKVERKANNRKYSVSVWFVAEDWYDEKEHKIFLRWKYSDVKVRELV